MSGVTKVKKLGGVIIDDTKDKLILKDNNGAVVSTIYLTRNYGLTIPYVGFCEAVYRVQQEDIVIEFSTSTRNAQHLVVEVLKIKGDYPPIAPWNKPF